MEECWFRFDLAGIWRSPFFNDFSIFFLFLQHAAFRKNAQQFRSQFALLFFPPNFKKNPERFRSKWKVDHPCIPHQISHHFHTAPANTTTRSTLSGPPTQDSVWINHAGSTFSKAQWPFESQSRHLSSWRTGWENGASKILVSILGWYEQFQNKPSIQNVWRSLVWGFGLMLGSSTLWVEVVS